MPLNPALAFLQGQTSPQQRTPSKQSFQIPDGVKQMVRAAKSVQNPAMLQSAVMKNPAFQQAQQIAAAFNGNYDQAIQSLCQQNGIDANELMEQLRNL